MMKMMMMILMRRQDEKCHTITDHKPLAGYPSYLQNIRKQISLSMKINLSYTYWWNRSNDFSFAEFLTVYWPICLTVHQSCRSTHHSRQGSGEWLLYQNSTQASISSPAAIQGCWLVLSGWGKSALLVPGSPDYLLCPAAATTMPPAWTATTRSCKTWLQTGLNQSQKPGDFLSPTRERGNIWHQHQGWILVRYSWTACDQMKKMLFSF